MNALDDNLMMGSNSAASSARGVNPGSDPAAYASLESRLSRLILQPVDPVRHRISANSVRGTATLRRRVARGIAAVPGQCRRPPECCERCRHPPGREPGLAVPDQGVDLHAGAARGGLGEQHCRRGQRQLNRFRGRPDDFAFRIGACRPPASPQPPPSRRRPGGRRPDRQGGPRAPADQSSQWSRAGSVQWWKAAGCARSASA